VQCQFAPPAGKIGRERSLDDAGGQFVGLVRKSGEIPFKPFGQVAPDGIEEDLHVSGGKRFPRPNAANVQHQVIGPCLWGRLMLRTMVEVVVVTVVRLADLAPRMAFPEAEVSITRPVVAD
jgi:hypothetical protein